MQKTQDMQGLIPGQGDPLEKEMAIHSSILAWKILWTEWPGGLQSIESQSWTRVKQLTRVHALIRDVNYIYRIPPQQYLDHLTKQLDTIA